MSEINMVDYTQMKSQISKIWSTGNDMHTAIIAIYNSLTEISSIWSGNKCNTFLTAWNEAVTNIATYSQFLQYDLAVYLNKVAKRFSEVDDNTISTSGYGWGPGIQEVELTDENTLRFLTSEVASFQSEFTKYKDTVTTSMNDILILVQALPWDSTSSAAFFTQFNKVTNTAVTSFNEIWTTMNTMITETSAAVESAESQNTAEGQAFGTTE